MKRYTNFDEIDRDLKFLKLKSKIDMEEFKLGLQNSKTTLSESLSPMNVVASTVGSIAKKAFVYKMVEKITGVRLRKRK